MSGESQRAQESMLGYDGLELMLTPDMRQLIFAAMDQQLEHNSVHRAFIDPAFESTHLGIASATNAIAGKIAGGRIVASERQAAYLTFHWARSVATLLFERPPLMDAEGFARVYQALPTEDIIAQADAYMWPRPQLQSLCPYFLPRLSWQGKFLRSAHVVAGLTFRAIDMAEKNRAMDHRTAEFGAQIHAYNRTGVIAAWLDPEDG